MAKVTVTVKYCGGWGYARYADALVDYLSKHLVEKDVALSTFKDPVVSGNFDVTVNGDLIYSKNKMGQGRATTEAERQTILEEIRERL